MSSKPKHGVDWKQFILEASSVVARMLFVTQHEAPRERLFMFANRDKRRSNIGCAVENDSFEN